jgi:hypothetical protein
MFHILVPLFIAVVAGGSVAMELAENIDEKTKTDKDSNKPDKRLK